MDIAELAFIWQQLPHSDIMGLDSKCYSVKGVILGVLDAGAFFGSIMQRLQVRFYSISSSPLLHPKSIHITCAVVYEKTATGTL